MMARRGQAPHGRTVNAMEPWTGMDAERNGRAVGLSPFDLSWRTRIAVLTASVVLVLILGAATRGAAATTPAAADDADSLSDVGFESAPDVTQRNDLNPGYSQELQAPAPPAAADDAGTEVCPGTSASRRCVEAMPYLVIYLPLPAPAPASTSASAPDLEEGSHLDESDTGEWVWMTNYRVWEAHRKVFLYPENWVEPELRDDETPPFEADAVCPAEDHARRCVEPVPSLVLYLKMAAAGGAAAAQPDPPTWTWTPAPVTACDLADGAAAPAAASCSTVPGLHSR